MGEVRSIAETWSTTEQKLGSLMEWWPPGASLDAIAECERALGVTLPTDYAQSVAIHDGSGTLLGRYELSSLDEVVRRAKVFEEIAASLGPPSPDHIRVTGPVRGPRWNRMWLPVVRTAGARSLVLDLDPLPAGNRGQVVEVSRELNAVNIKTPSFAVWLERFADELATDENPLF